MVAVIRIDSDSDPDSDPDIKIGVGVGIAIGIEKNVPPQYEALSIRQPAYWI